MNTEPRTWNPGDSLILPPADNDNGDHQLDPPPANYAVSDHRILLMSTDDADLIEAPQ